MQRPHRPQSAARSPAPALAHSSARTADCSVTSLLASMTAPATSHSDAAFEPRAARAGGASVAAWPAAPHHLPALLCRFNPPCPAAAMAAAAAQMAPAEAPAMNAYGDAFRDYSLTATPRQRAVAAFYAEQHAKQTHAFVQAQKAKHLSLARREMSIWEAAGAHASGCAVGCAARAARMRRLKAPVTRCRATERGYRRQRPGSGPPAGAPSALRAAMQPLPARALHQYAQRPAAPFRPRTPCGSTAHARAQRSGLAWADAWPHGRYSTYCRLRRRRARRTPTRSGCT